MNVSILIFLPPLPFVTFSHLTQSGWNKFRFLLELSFLLFFPNYQNSTMLNSEYFGSRENYKNKESSINPYSGDKLFWYFDIFACCLFSTLNPMFCFNGRGLTECIVAYPETYFMTCFIHLLNRVQISPEISETQSPMNREEPCTLSGTWVQLTPTNHGPAGRPSAQCQDSCPESSVNPFSFSDTLPLVLRLFWHIISVIANTECLLFWVLHSSNSTTILHLCINTIAIPIIRMMKLKHREVR